MHIRKCKLLNVLPTRNKRQFPTISIASETLNAAVFLMENVHYNLTVERNFENLPGCDGTLNYLKAENL